MAKMRDISAPSGGSKYPSSCPGVAGPFPVHDNSKKYLTITVNGHSWKSRVAIMRGRFLIGLSNANRQAAGDEVEVELEYDAEVPVVTEPADFTRALDADPAARAELAARYEALNDEFLRRARRAWAQPS